MLAALSGTLWAGSLAAGHLLRLEWLAAALAALRMLRPSASGPPDRIRPGKVAGAGAGLGAVTGLPGKYVTVADTVRSFKEIVAGKYDHLPEQAFYMVGTIEEAVEKAEKMKA